MKILELKNDAAVIVFCCYLAGTALAVLSVQRIKLLRILSERE